MMSGASNVKRSVRLTKERFIFSAAARAKLGSKADAGRGKAQRVEILACCSKIMGITCSASLNTALDSLFGTETGSKYEIFGNSLTRDVSNG
ncbi:MAG: hypothetical protein ACKVH1_18205 [Alphaproteobacteria bacterium]